MDCLYFWIVFYYIIYDYRRNYQKLCLFKFQYFLIKEKKYLFYHEKGIDCHIKKFGVSVKKFTKNATFLKINVVINAKNSIPNIVFTEYYYIKIN